MISDQDTIDQGFDLFRALVDEDPNLREEYEASADHYFRSGRSATSEHEKALGERRHLEWFLIERNSPTRDAPLIVELFERSGRRGQVFGKAQQQTFLNSQAGIFEVTGVRAGEGVWVRDLTGLGEFPLIEPDASSALRTGDLIAGRIFPLGDSVFHVSRAAAFFRNPELLEGLHKDIRRAREGRRGALRLSQIEIEAMFFGPHATTPATDPIADARRMLHGAGLDREQVEAVLVDLARRPAAADDSPFADSEVLGEILDRLAFETEIDLDAARRVLLQARVALARPRTSPAAAVRADDRSAAEPINVAQLVAEFDRKRRSGVPLEQLFDELEHDLALDEPEGDGDEATPAPDFPGVVAAIVEEFLWEISREKGAQAASECEVLRSLGRCCAHIGVLENFGLRELLSYTCVWLPESGELHNADQAQQLLSALQEFSRWLERSQQLPLDPRFKPILKSLRVSLPRIVEANRRRTRAADPEQGVAFELLAIDDEEAVRLRDPDGREVAAALDAWISHWLRPGDRIRGQVTDGRLAVYCCYPPEGAALATT